MFSCYSNDFLDEWDGSLPQGNIQLAERQDSAEAEDTSRFPEEEADPPPFPSTPSAQETAAPEESVESGFQEREFDPYASSYPDQESGNNNNGHGGKDEGPAPWGISDSRTIAIIISICVILGVVLHALRRYKLSIKLLVVNRRDGGRGNRRVAPMDPNSSTARFRQTQRSEVALRNLAWRHDMGGNGGSTGNLQRSASSSRLPWEHNPPNPFNGSNNSISRSMPNVLSAGDGLSRTLSWGRSNGGRANSNRNMLGRRARSDDVELGAASDFDGEDQAVQESLAMQRRNEAGNTGQGLFFNGAPQQPAPISLPAHLQRNNSNRPASSGGSQREEVPEGQECAICMEARKGAGFKPCGHADLCLGCAEHILQTTKQCPICRADVRGIKRPGQRNRRGFFG